MAPRAHADLFAGPTVRGQPPREAREMLVPRMAALFTLGVLLFVVAAGLAISRRRRRSAQQNAIQESGVPVLSFGPRPSNSRLDDRG